MNLSQVLAGTMAVLALLITGLSVQVSRLRIRHRISFGDGGHKDLLVAIRAHGNALEQTTLFALLAVSYIGLPEASAGHLLACCVAFASARAVHAFAMFTRRLSWRQAAHLMSVLAQLVLVLGIAWAM